MANLFNPDCIVPGGYLAQASPYCFLQPVEPAIHKYSLKLMSRHVPVVTSAPGVDAGVTGACMVARGRVFGDT